MAKLTLPWDDDNEVIPYEYVNPRKSFSEKYAYFITFLLMILGIFSKYKLSLFLSLLLLLSLVSKKYVAATSKGLEIYTNMRIFKNYSLLEWSDIDAITYERKPEQKKLILLYFTKGDTTKRFFFKEEDMEKVFDLAKKYNKKIKVHDAQTYKQNLKIAKERLKNK